MEWKGPESLKPGTEKARVVRIRNGKADIYKTGMEQDGMYKTGIENPESLKSGTEKAGISIRNYRNFHVNGKQPISLNLEWKNPESIKPRTEKARTFKSGLEKPPNL